MSDDGDMDAYGPMGIDKLLSEVFCQWLYLLPVETEEVGEEVGEVLEQWTGWVCVEWLGDGSPDVFLTGILRNCLESINA